ncbi:hypothetical protein [Bordetella genomosp. 10]|uniref:hypothetical protein n=1 Tax=Bordetella genomosp. 10 TaxID=1416804 RepID=UPI001177667D|nr:hypothetical protein [Bordetella genomosp. 10]
MNGGTARRAAPGRPVIQSVVRLEEYHALFTGPEQCDRLASLLRATGEKIWNASAARPPPIQKLHPRTKAKRKENRAAWRDGNLSNRSSHDQALVVGHDS